MFTDNEIKERLPVWTVLSELFLDASFDSADYDRIAAILNQSPYSRIDIERILRTEVSPAFSWNLFSIAGEWVRWGEDEVYEIVTNSIERRASPGLFSKIRKIVTPNVFPSDWRSIAKRLGDKSGLPQ